MKKIIGIILVTVMVFSMAACGENESTAETAENTETVVTTDVIEEDNITTSPEEEIKIISFSCDKEGQEIEVGSGELITFTVEIESDTKLDKENVQLVAVDSLGRNHSYNMNDNGVADEVADDGIYTCGLFNTLDEPLVTEYHVEVNGTINSDVITLETHEKETTTSADELGITTGEMTNLFLDMNLPAHNFADMDDVEGQVNMGAKMAFEHDSTNYSYSVGASDYYGFAVWTDNDNNLAEIAERAINGDESAKEAWDSLQDLSINQAEMIDVWTGVTLDDESYHTAVAIMNEENTSLLLLVVYDGEIIYDATETQ